MPGSGFVMRLAKPLISLQISRYRRATSPEPPYMMGFPTVLLTTVGAKTGKERTHVLEVRPRNRVHAKAPARKGAGTAESRGPATDVIGRETEVCRVRWRVESKP
jgi:hypothetical protein